MTRRPLPVPLRLYRGAASFATVLAPAWLKYRVRKGKEDPARIAERRGITRVERPQGPLIWVHGASVGEIVSILPLVERLQDRGFAILLTSGTLTSSRVAARRAPASVIHQFVPLDAPAFVRRFLDHWKPDLALLAESELWPNLMTELDKRGTAVVLVNGRLSARSAQRWARLPRSARALLSRVDLCLAQTPEDAARFRGLGAPRVQVAGNLKFDVPAPPADPSMLARLQAAIGERPVLLAASTHPGEDEYVLEAHGRLRQDLPGLLTIIAPRHPERGGAIRQLAHDAGFAATQRSQAPLPLPEAEVYVADTIGEMGLFYRVAPVAFLGGSLIEHGGQNPIEPAKIGTVVLHGPHVWNFAAVYGRLDEAAGSVPVMDAEDIVRATLDIFFTPGCHERISHAAWQTVENLSGALPRTLAAIEPYLLQIRLEGK
ncbi:3-deoxy-D-manno-octulosonic acid transferase-like protein [Azorhizobium caulinodans ORS 571]|uniref:3-deoxy-D-manno-octulosonic acid transferase n=1 Tax=Azorhizobium caulinodans (strain ATCC 43989 / DSM 5975 / JCM 20966 / LMG 6465 / NBRC 14845 / NCIMB 13405 / ORS 571) TaxID=438753 RepID=A8I6A0_AZOC5|nr:3-deoxy-D-manno-octulosonic acid transferase [Azorhizobium caulinodans]BAF88380.1 3-deoxy-D-manno-octulosonic acid transferase-like protein [Azorhizobium caulinodans ORS 571]